MKKFLLDTQVLIWWAQEPGKINATAALHLNSNNDLLLSLVSVWGMAIKIKTGKLRLGMNLEEFIKKAVEKHSLQILSISFSHIYRIEKLELHHKDPFDRLLIAQSIVEDIPIVSSDVVFDAYGIQRIW